jgi:hypothetical protein
MRDVTPASIGTQLARWSALLLLTLAGLWLLSDALFSAWVAGGPPNEHKLGWERRSLAALCMSAASFLAGFAAFRAIPRVPRIGKAAWTLILLAGAIATAPWVARELLIDACLDAGGSWNRDFLECSR